MRPLHDINPNFRNSPVYPYIPFPGTPMFDTAVAAGFEPPQTLEGWSRFSYEGGSNGTIPIGSEAPEFYERLYFTTLCNDRKVDEYTVPPVTRLAARMYRPIANFRLKHLYFGLMPEMQLARRALRGA